MTTIVPTTPLDRQRVEAFIGQVLTGLGATANTALRSLIAASACLMLLLGASASASAAVVFDGSPGTGPPPARLGPYTMTPFEPDSRPDGDPVSTVPGPLGDIAFGTPLEHRRVPSSWVTWSHGYTGDVYAAIDGVTATIVLPPGTGAFAFYAEPNQPDAFSITAVSGSSSSGPVPVTGHAGARYFGFYASPGESLHAITVTLTGSGQGFAIGELLTAPSRSTRRPFVDLVTPNSGPTRGGQTITIRGENFADGTGILFAKTPASSVEVVNHTTLRVVTPAHRAGGYDITAVNRNGRSPQVDAAAYTFVRHH